MVFKIRDDPLDIKLIFIIYYLYYHPTNIIYHISYIIMSRKIITDDYSDNDHDNDNDNKPKGLLYFKNIIDKKYSNSLFSFLDEDQKYLWKSLSDSKNSRKAKHYGYIYNYKSGKTTVKTDPIPLEFQQLIETLKENCGDEKYDFNQIIVNNYDSGQGISAHTDVKEYGEIIGCYTLGSGATMRFTKGTQKYDLYVHPNSLYIMTGESRYNWKHEMPSRKSDMVDGVKIKRDRRISITFRCVK